MAKRQYIIAGAPFYVDNVKGKLCVANAGTGQVIKDNFVKPSEARALADLLNEAYSDGYQDCDIKHARMKAKEKA